MNTVYAVESRVAYGKLLRQWVHVGLFTTPQRAQAQIVREQLYDRIREDASSTHGVGDILADDYGTIEYRVREVSVK